MMKKYIKWFSILVLSFVISGCGFFSNDDGDLNGNEEPVEQPAESPDETDNGEETDTPGQPEEDEVNQEVTAWIPRLENVVYSYEGIGSEYASFTWNPQFNKEDYYQIAANNGGTVLVKIYEFTDDQIARIFRSPETYFRDNFSEIGTFPENLDTEVILKAPIEVGTTWANDTTEYEITAVNHEVEVPAGTYNTIEVTMTADNSTVKRYYAEDIGLVSEVSETADGHVVESHLETAETNAPEIIPFTVYVPDDQAMGMDTIQTELTLYTNDPARIAINDLLTGQVEEYDEINLLPEGTEINYMFLNNDRVVEVDVSEEFETNMNAGSTGELFGLYTFVNTLANYYGTEEVLLTVDGEPYEGGHIILREGETLQFNHEMVNE